MPEQQQPKIVRPVLSVTSVQYGVTGPLVGMWRTGKHPLPPLPISPYLIGQSRFPSANQLGSSSRTLACHTDTRPLTHRQSNISQPTHPLSIDLTLGEIYLSQLETPFFNLSMHYHCTSRASNTPQLTKTFHVTVTTYYYLGVGR